MGSSGYRRAFLFLVPFAALCAMGACGLEEGGFGQPGGNFLDSSTTEPPSSDRESGAPDDPADTGSSTDARQDPACPENQFRCGTICVENCYTGCGQQLSCASSKTCTASCASCSGTIKACYQCADGVTPSGSCELLKGECYGGVYTPCSCSSAATGTGDVTKCPGADQACLHLNERNYVCKTCGDKETDDKACGKTGSRKCETDDGIGVCE